MKRMVVWFAAAAAFCGLATVASAAPSAAGLQPVSALAAEAGAALVSEVGYYRRHWARRAYHRPIRFRRVYHRPVYYRPVYVRPARYHAPRCVIRERLVFTVYGWVAQPVRVCRY